MALPPLKLVRLNAAEPIVDAQGRPVSKFQVAWQTNANRVEAQEARQDQDIVAIQAAQAAADAAQLDADNALAGVAAQVAALDDLVAGVTAFTAINVNGDVVGSLGTASALNVGTTAGTVAAGDDSRFASAKPVYSTVGTNVDFTITRAASFNFVRHTGVLTADRSATLSTLGAVAGDSIRLTRTGAGAFNLNIAGKALVTNSFADAIYDGAAWYLAAYGAF